MEITLLAYPDDELSLEGVHSHIARDGGWNRGRLTLLDQLWWHLVTSARATVVSTSLTMNRKS